MSCVSPRVFTYAACIATALAACSAQDGAPIDRMASPEAAFIAARTALHRHDLPAYFDAITDTAVIETLKNSITICLASNNQDAIRQGVRPSFGCENILRKYEWKAPVVSDPSKSDAVWKAALKSIPNPREMGAELEARHRNAGAGSSFVWDYLDPVKLGPISIDGSKAKATSRWDGQPVVIRFERDSTGWRVNTFPEEEQVN